MRRYEDPGVVVSTIGEAVSAAAPVRLSFCGGGTDLPEYVSRRGAGAVVSASIDQRVHVALRRSPVTSIACPDLGLTCGGRSIQELEDREPRLALVTNALLASGVSRGVEVTVSADVPNESGLGLSSATAVALLAAGAAFRGEPQQSNVDLAERAFEVERERIGDRLGRQDHYAAAFGGFNRFDFRPDGPAAVRPIAVDGPPLRKLQEQLLLFVTPLRGRSNAVLKQQTDQLLNNDPATMKALDQMLERCSDVESFLLDGDIVSLAALLEETWQLKRSISADVATAELDLWYRSAVGAGALGGKVTGAGGRGSLMLIVPPDRQPAVIDVLCPPLRQVRFRLPWFATTDAESERSCNNRS